MPAHRSTPDPPASSAQPKSAATAWPAVNVAPSAGALMRTSGARSSTTVIRATFERTRSGPPLAPAVAVNLTV